MKVRDADARHAVEIRMVCFQQRALICSPDQVRGPIFKTELPKTPGDAGSAGEKSGWKWFTRGLVEFLLEPVGRRFGNFEATFFERVKHATRAETETQRICAMNERIDGKETVISIGTNVCQDELAQLLGDLFSVIRVDIVGKVRRLDLRGLVEQFTRATSGQLVFCEARNDVDEFSFGPADIDQYSPDYSVEEIRLERGQRGNGKQHVKHVCREGEKIVFEVLRVLKIGRASCRER